MNVHPLWYVAVPVLAFLGWLLLESGPSPAQYSGPQLPPPPAPSPPITTSKDAEPPFVPGFSVSGLIGKGKTTPHESAILVFDGGEPFVPKMRPPRHHEWRYLAPRLEGRA